MELLFLGTGTSHGVPMIGCDCAVCTSADPRDRRTRASVLLSWDGRCVVVDTTPDFRHQMLTHGVRRVDAVLYTHHHADHIHGVDDVRVFSTRSRRPLPAYAGPDTCRFFRQNFRYIFEVNPANLNVPRLDMQAVNGSFELLGRRIVPVPVQHGPDVILGYRVDGVAYLPDCNGIPPASRALLADLDVLVLDALRPEPHPSHFSLDESLEVARQLRPRRTWLTGLSHRLGHAATSACLTPGVQVAYDGLRLHVR